MKDRKKFRLTLLSTLACCAFGFTGYGQDVTASANIRFGEVAVADFAATPGEAGADAIILADIGSTSLEGYEEGFRIVYTRFRRIRILRPQWLRSNATVTLDFSKEDNNSSRIKSLRANTYNLENGKVVRTPWERKDHFSDKQSDDEVEEKFTFPNVKVGSIVEYTYSIKSSDFYELHSWYFQGEYPTRYSEYTVRIPELFNYVSLTRGKKPDTTLVSEAPERTFVVGRVWFSTHIQSTTWIMKDVPAIQDAPYISTLKNYRSSIKFQCSTMPISAGRATNILGDWQTASDRLLDNDRFGKAIAGKPEWLTKEVNTLTTGVGDTLEKARRIYAFIRDHFTVGGLGVMLWSGEGLEDVYKQRKGSVPALNLLLIAMLRAANIDADPVILSTRDHGLTNSAYPIVDQYNYLVAKAGIAGVSYYLDATDRRQGFGHLPLYCYNGHARVITKSNYPVYLEPDSLQETSMTTVFIVNDSDRLDGTYTLTPGYFESFDIRNELAQTNVKGFLAEKAKSFPTDIKLDTSADVESLEQLDKPLSLRYGIKMELKDEHLYLNPMLGTAIQTNPFAAEERLFPVEMPYRTDDTYVLNMEIPKGYSVEELPKSARVNLNEGDGSYEYIIAQAGDHLQLKSRLVLKKAIFGPEDYATLREFYAFIVKKQGETIVFKRGK